MYPVLLHLGPLSIYSFGAAVAVAFLVSGYLTGREMERKGLPAELASNLVFWAALGGVLGARLWALAEHWGDVLNDPFEMILSEAGFTWYGGLVGGTLAATWFIRRAGLPWLSVADSAAPAIALGHAIGRIGCHLAGDGDWGGVSTLPWAVAYRDAVIGWNYPPGIRVHPTPLYEFLAYTAIFAVLWGIRKQDRPPGALFCWYLVLAATARFLVEFLRINPTVGAGLSEAQFFSIGLIMCASLPLWQSSRTRRLARSSG